MHTSRRFLIVATLVTALIPFGTVSMLHADVRTDAQDMFISVLDRATRQYRMRLGLSVTNSASEKFLQEGRARLRVLEKEKRATRMQIVAMRTVLGITRERIDTLSAQHERASILLEQQQEQLRTFLRLAALHRLTDDATGIRGARTFFRRMFGESLGTNVAETLREDALAEARQTLMLQIIQAQESTVLMVDQMHGAAGTFGDAFLALQEKHDVELKEYYTLIRKLESAERTVSLTDEQLAQIQQTVQEVHEEVLRMQGELARIDARIKRRAERALIEKGLRAPRPSEHSDGTVAAHPSLAWPALGPIAAGFHEASYRKFFGIPHEGIDIVMPQGSVVHSAAEGVVFVVKDGGATGYTYVLIGHRDGYATLYGHLSSVTVAAGQDIHQGDAIGLSGGMPGTAGAGLMTTGPHLHFEVIQRGTNVDPDGLLP